METSIFDPGETGAGWCCRILDVQLEATGKNTALKAGEVAVILKETMVQPYSKRLLTEDPMTLQEIGGKFGIIGERVRQIESSLKKKLKIYLEEEIADIDLLQESMIEI
jgi:hypothetical protein